MIATLKLHPIRFAAIFVCSTAAGAAAFYVPHAPHLAPAAVIQSPRMTPWRDADDGIVLERFIRPARMTNFRNNRL